MSLTIFNREELESAIQKVIPDLPDGHKNAVAVAVDNEGAKLAFTIHLNELGGVDALGYGAHLWNNDNVVGAELIKSW
jgi:hypothetical protein